MTARKGADRPAVVAGKDTLELPGLASAHSHAFQRALRGRTQRQEQAAGSFWSWRGLMYQLAERMTPDDAFALSRFAYCELAMAGVTAVGEFHYLHHAPGGQPYSQRTAMAEAVIEAAREVGIRVNLLRVIYQRAGQGRPPEGAQKRFSDTELDSALQDIETLRSRYAADPLVEVGVAPHSVRAVTLDWILATREAARSGQWAFHMHVAEQRRELQECLAEHGLRPIELLHEHGALGPTFVGVHATHLQPSEVAALGESQSIVCLCRTTERDLGDGLPACRDLVRAGVRLCTGVDSHAISDPFEEARAIELDERSRTEERHVAVEAPSLLEITSKNGYDAIGFAEAWQADRVLLNRNDPALVGASAELLEDAVFFGANPRAVRQVSVHGADLLEEGIHGQYPRYRKDYDKTLNRLGL